MSSESTLTRYLQDAHALESALRRTLLAHIAVSARDEHRELLQEHLRVTTAQQRRLAGRLSDLGVASNPAQAVAGAAKEAAALALTLAKGPADALRGPTGDDVTLRNAQDECASEALEIAVYDALEVLAEQAGDEQTARLARRHRQQEQDFLERLHELLPQLARNVAGHERGRRRFPLSALGAIDGLRALARGLQAVLRPEDEHGQAPRPSAAAPAPPPATPRRVAKPRPVAQPRPKAKPAAKPKPTPAAGPKPTPAAEPKPTPSPAPASPPRGEERTTADREAAPRADQPLAEYDDMTPYEITELLDHLPDAKLDEVERYERAHAHREQVLHAIEKQRAATGA